MSKKVGSLLLVVDADILRAAGDSGGHASKTRDVLQAILQICHRVILSGEAGRESDKHASRFLLPGGQPCKAGERSSPLRCN